ncbi:hypothetical protein [Paraferrimonas haliotis]|nr:hypothetical protein [Paraferrimonas haliotis]
MSIVVLGSLLITTSAVAGPQVGIMVGSDNGVSIRHHGYQVEVGINDASIALDKTYYFNNSPYFYWGGGVKWQDHSNRKLGARAVFGAATKVEDFVFFAEAKPIFYVVNGASVQLEGTLGVRYQF